MGCWMYDVIRSERIFDKCVFTNGRANIKNNFAVQIALSISILHFRDSPYSPSPIDSPSHLPHTEHWTENKIKKFGKMSKIKTSSEKKAEFFLLCLLKKRKLDMSNTVCDATCVLIQSGFAHSFYLACLLAIYPSPQFSQTKKRYLFANALSIAFSLRPVWYERFFGWWRLKWLARLQLPTGSRFFVLISIST